MADKKSTSSKPAWVRFFPSDYIAGTSKMPRMVRSVYDDIMIHNFDKNRPMSKSEAMLIFNDFDDGAVEIITLLLDIEKIAENDQGYYVPRAMDEAAWSWNQWEAKSRGGKKGGLKGKKPDEESTDGKSDTKTVGKTDQSDPEGVHQQNQSHSQNQNHIESEATASASSSSSGDEIDDSENDAAKLVLEAQEKADLIRSHMTLIPPAWNEMALSNGLTEITSVSDKRKELIRGVVGAYEIDDVLEVIKSIPDSDFLLGENEKMGPVKFDWVMRNFGKIKDGEYHDDKPETPAPAPKLEAVRELDSEPDIAKKVRELLIKKVGEDKFAYKFRGIEFFQKDDQLVVAGASSGIAQDLIIVQRGLIEAVAEQVGLSGVTHSSIATAKKYTEQLDTDQKDD